MKPRGVRVGGADLGYVRKHPGYESPEAPPVNMTPWPPEVARAPRAPVIPPAPQSTHARTAGPQWAVGIATVVTALGTALGGIGWTYTEIRKHAAAESVAQSQRFDRIEAMLATVVEDQQARDIVQLAVLCELNGGPPAKNVRCPPTACATPERTADGKIIGPICRATVDWPPVRSAPVRHTP